MPSVAVPAVVAGDRKACVQQLELHVEPADVYVAEQTPVLVPVSSCAGRELGLLASDTGDQQGGGIVGAALAGLGGVDADESDTLTTDHDDGVAVDHPLHVSG